MKKALFILLSMLLTLGLVVNAGALTLESVETAQEAVTNDFSVAELNEATMAEKPAEYNDTYGQLIMFANANKDDTYINYVNATPLGFTETTQTFDGKTGFLVNDKVC